MNFYVLLAITLAALVILREPLFGGIEREKQILREMEEADRRHETEKAATLAVYTVVLDRMRNGDDISDASAIEIAETANAGIDVVFDSLDRMRDAQKYTIDWDNELNT